MTNHALRLAAVLTYTLVLPSTVLALEPTYKSLEAKSTPVSGYDGRLEALELGTANGQAVYGLWSRESGNRPCQLAVRARNLNANSTDATAGDIATDCTSGTKMLEVNFSDNPRYFVRGIGVCSSKTGNKKRMKGFKIVAAKVWQTKRQIDDLATTETDTRNNCAGDWHDTVYCDPGDVASGVNVYWDRDEDAITGLGLRCRRIAWLGSE